MCPLFTDELSGGLTFGLDRSVWLPGGTQLELGTDVQPKVLTHHPITKPEKMQICDLCFVKGPFLNQSVLFTK